jgi:hypothetical protein
MHAHVSARIISKNVLWAQPNGPLHLTYRQRTVLVQAEMSALKEALRTLSVDRLVERVVHALRMAEIHDQTTEQLRGIYGT